MSVESGFGIISPGEPTVPPTTETPFEPSRRRFRVTPVGRLLIPLALIGLIGLLAPILPIPGPNQQNLLHNLQPPIGFGGTWSHPLGTDQLGRDELSRLIWGARMTFFIGITAVALAGTVGILLGIGAGYLRGSFDVVVSRVVDAQLALPFLLLALAILASGQSITALVLVLAISGWAQFARILRGDTIVLRGRPFVTGLRASGMSSARVMVRHIVPNVLSSIVVIATLEIGTMILGEGALSFLGLGVEEPNVSWGLMLAEGRNYLSSAWWIVVIPGIAITVVVLLSNLAGDALRLRYDPKLKTSRS
ncbi:MAG TPA: ABC transporter permease [Gaiellaceae bacterium]|jgi:peptide/nickel transport system permease protein|nr:ABC transporter permease [Gaiellaceae bacterium]